MEREREGERDGGRWGVWSNVREFQFHEKTNLKYLLIAEINL